MGTRSDFARRLGLPDDRYFLKGHGMTISESVYEPAPAHMRFVAVGQGYWGRGPTVAEAIFAAARAGGIRVNTMLGLCDLYCFVSDVPFAPVDRDAEDHEADAYVSPGGGIAWVNCQRRDLQ